MVKTFTLGDTSSSLVRKFPTSRRPRIFIAVGSAVIFFLISAAIILPIVLVLKLSNQIQPYKCDISTIYKPNFSSYLGSYSQLAVAADRAECSTVGKNILLQNGSAVDAAIATALCENVMSPQSAGIGGGHFMVIYLRDKKQVYAIDAREQAPASAYKEMFFNASSQVGGLSTGIPGEFYGFWEAYKLGGKLPWKKLFEPAINISRRGVRVTRDMEFYFAYCEPDIRKNKKLSQIFLNKTTNQTLRENDYYTMPDLANTLEYLSNSNLSGFYDSNLTRIMVKEINDNGGNVTLEDFKNYKAYVKTPITVSLDDDFILHTVPPPSSGIIISVILRILKGYNIKQTDDQSTLFYHHLIEAFKHSFSLRSKLGDERFINLTSLLNELNDTNFIDSIRSKINDFKTYPSSYYGSKFRLDDHGTSHLSVYAPNGDAVALTSTINLLLGAKYAGDTTGIIYNNQMDDFSTPNLINYFGYVPSEANYIQPGKRPLSSMSPTIVVNKNGDARLVIGGAGGSKIISGVSQTIIRNLWMNMSMRDAIDSRRVHHQLYPEYAELEIGFNEDIGTGLKQLGHTLTCTDFVFACVQGISIDQSRKIQATSDDRWGGVADGL